jgi:DNA polymerase III alpha subunit (gram-positive type)
LLRHGGTIPSAESFAECEGESLVGCIAVGNGESIQSEMAKKIARTNALAKLASQIEVTVKQVNDDYSSQLQVSDRQEVNQIFESLTRTVVKQTLNDVKDVKDEMRFLKDKDRYNYYLGIEVNTEPGCT